MSRLRPIIYCIRCGEYKKGSNPRAKLCDDCKAQGFRYCPVCMHVLPITAFSATGKYCRQCSTAYSNDRYANDDEFRKAEILRLTNKKNVRSRKAVGTYTLVEWQQCLDYFNHSCAYCGGSNELTVDHVVALSNGGYNVAFNLVPACTACNSSKGAKDIITWYTEQTFFNEDRLFKIHSRYKSLQGILLKGGQQ